MMLIISAFLFALMLATGQSLWKAAVNKNPVESLSFPVLMQVLFSPLFIAGLVLYELSVVIYLYALSHFEFNKVQALAIPLSLIFSILSAWLIFQEDIKMTTVAGIVVILVGIYLVVVA